eukprot:366095-Chlamydomonas_euryale.AAC.21
MAIRAVYDTAIHTPTQAVGPHNGAARSRSTSDGCSLKRLSITTSGGAACFDASSQSLHSSSPPSQAANIA